jgi:hypothetical protein
MSEVMDNNTDNPNSQYSGVSNPPNNGDVTSVDTPPQGTGSAPASGDVPSGDTPEAAQPPQQQGKAGPVANGASAATGIQSAQMGVQKAAQKPQAPAAPPQQPQQHPSIQKASILHSIAETLAGGPRYTYDMDANTGEMKKVKAPMGRGDIAMAIAMEAISGALTGLSQTGPGGVGRGGALAFQQTNSRLQHQQQDTDQQASAEFARHMQVVETNMRMHQNALVAGRMGLEMNEKVVEQYKSLADMLQKDYPQAIRGEVTESQLSQYHVTKDQAIPVGVVARLDPQTGKQSENAFGEPQWDMRYLVVDPNVTGQFLTPEMKKLGAALRMPGFAGSDGKELDLPMNQALKLSLSLGLQSKFTSFHLAEQDMKEYYDKLNTGFGGASGVLTKEPEMKNSEIQQIVDHAADTNNVPRGLLRAIVMRESNENSKAVSPAGAQGLGQLMPDTARQMGVKNPFDAEDNANGSAKYLRLLMDNPKFKGNTKLILAAYNAGPGNVTDHVPQNGETEQYVADISKAIGLDAAVSDKAKLAPVDLMEQVQKDPTLMSALEQFQPMLSQTGNYEKAIGELGQKDPKAAGKIMQLYGGREAMQQYDEQHALALDATKRTQDDALAEQKAKVIAQQKHDLDLKSSNEMKLMLKGPADYKFSDDMRDMDQGELGEELQKKGVAVPDNFADLYAMAHNMSDPKGYASRVWSKGSPSEMDLQSARTYIRKYINPNWDEKQYGSMSMALKRFTDPDSKTGQQIRSFNTLFDHIGDAFDAVNELRNTNLPLLNRPLNTIKKEALGDTNVTTVLAAIEPVKKEFMTFLLNNHALTESDKKSGDELLDMHFTVAQLQDQLRQFAKTSALRATEVNNDYHRKFGSSIPGLISPNAIDTIRKMPELLKITGFGDLNTGGVAFTLPSGRDEAGQSVTDTIKVPGYDKSGNIKYYKLPDGTVLDTHGKVVGNANTASNAGGR